MREHASEGNESVREADSPDHLQSGLTDAPGTPGRVLSIAQVALLQRTAGNAAVARVLRERAKDRAGNGNRATVRLLARRLTVKPQDLSKEGKKDLREQIELIQQALGGYESEPAAGRRVQVLEYIEGRILAWEIAGGRWDSKQGGKLTRLLGEVRVELGEMKVQAEYMADLAKGRSKFKYMSTFAPSAVAQAEHLATGQTSKVVGEDEESLRVMKAQGLTDAEVAAVKIYTVGDFAYINPALAGSADPKSSARKWLKGNLENALDISNDVSDVGLQQASAEGKRHGRFFMTAFEKLPEYAGGAWRGTRRSGADFDKEFVEGKHVSFGSFLSMSKKRSVSEDFAYKRQKKDPADVVSIMIACKLSDSRDVAGLSLKRDEAEVVLAPGARFRIDKIEPDLLAADARPIGIPAYVVHCTQVK